MFNRITRSIFPAVGVLLLILDSRTALAGAQSAVELCFSSVIPTLFPFLVMSAMLTSSINESNLRLLRPMNRLLGIPNGTEGIFLTGILGGYPTGAQAVYQSWKSGQLSRADAKRMLTFCSNAGPAFIFGILGTKFTYGWVPWLLWGVHILSAVFIAIIVPKNKSLGGRTSSSKPICLTQSLKMAVITMGYICGWIVIFRIVLSFMDRWVLWLLPVEARVTVYGLLELANGCCSADLITSEGFRFILCSVMLSFGGCCVAMQTASVTGELGNGDYLKGKALQAVISFIISTVIQLLVFTDSNRESIPPHTIAIAVFILLIYCIVQRKNKKKSSISALIGV